MVKPTRRDVQQPTQELRLFFVLAAGLYLVLVLLGLHAISRAEMIPLGNRRLFVAVLGGLVLLSVWLAQRLWVLQKKAAASEQCFHDLFRYAHEGVAIHELIVDEKGEPVDCVFLDVNDAFETYSGLQATDIIGKRITQVLPGIEEAQLIARYGQVVLKGEVIRFEQFCESRQKHYLVVAYPMGGCRFVVACEDITERVAAEQAIQHQGGVIKSLLDCIPDSVFFKDIHGVYQGCNPSFAEQVGLAREDIIGKTSYDLFRQEVADSLRKQDQRILATNESLRYEEWLVYPDGRRVLFDGVKTPFWGPDGELIGILGVGRDRTAQKQAEEKLAKRDRLLTKLSEQVPGAIYQYQRYPDGTSRFPFASNGIWDVYEVTPDEVKTDASTVFSRIHPEDHDRVVASIRQSYASLGMWNDEYRVVLPEKGLRWVRGLARPEKLSDGSVLWHGYLTDVSSMKQVALELASQKNLLEGVIDGMHDVLAIQYPDHTIERYNQAGYRLLGLTPEEVRGKTCFSLLGRSEECELCATRKALISKEMETVEKYIPETGTHLVCHSTPILDADGEVVRVVEQLRDVTESKRQEMRIREERDYMFRLFNAMDQYVIVDGVDYRIQFMNQKAQEDFGDLVGSICYEQLERQSPCPSCPIDQLLRGEEDSKVNYTVEAFGRILEGTATLLTNLDGSRSILEVLHDVTVQREMENALRQREEQLSSIFANARDVLWSCAYPSYEVLFISPAILEVYGYGDEEFRDRPELWTAVVHPDDQWISQAHLDLLEREGAATSEYRIVKLDGAVRWVSDARYKVYSEEGEAIRVDGVISDITERRQAEEKLVEYIGELEMRGLELDALYRLLNQEMNNARHVHRRLLQVALPSVTGFSLAAMHAAATYIGGDFSQVIRKENKLVVYLSDVTGHGLDGTMFSLFVKNTIESYVELTPLGDLSTESTLAYLDRQVRKAMYPSEYAVAIFLMIVDLNTHQASFSAAGFQNPPMLVTAGGDIQFLVSQGLPISRDVPSEVMDFRAESIALPKEAFLFLATDGLYEQRQGDAMYGLRLANVLRDCRGLPADTIVDQVEGDFEEFCSDEDQADDVTVVVLSMGTTEEFFVPSSFDALAEVRERVRQYYGDDAHSDEIAMAAHELVANAIEHGNQLDASKSVRVQLTPRAMVVEDQGEGFAWRSRVGRPPSLDLDSERGRGMAMVDMLVGDLLYNQRGNRVSLRYR